MRAEALNTEPLEAEREDPALRPQSLSEFIGQSALKDNLSVFIKAARKANRAMDHVLLHGPPGLGKTTLAQIVAKELGVNFRSTSGPVIVRAGDLAAILTNLQPNDVLFIDEIHRLNPVVEEILDPAREDRKLDVLIGEGPAARSVQIDLAPFTLVGATTRAGMLTRPLRERFGILLRVEFYTESELSLVIQRAAKKMGVSIAVDGADEIAKRARGTPRIAGRLIRRVADFASVDDVDTITRSLADKALLRLDIDATGLDTMDRRYLKCIADHYGGGPVGVETLAAALSEQRDVLEDVIEPYLMQQGLLARTPRGRCLSATGYKYLGLTAPPTALQQGTFFDDAQD